MVLETRKSKSRALASAKGLRGELSHGQRAGEHDGKKAREEGVELTFSSGICSTPHYDTHSFLRAGR